MSDRIAARGAFSNAEIAEGLVEAMPDTPRPRTFKEVVAAKDDFAERARIEKGERFDDLTVGNPFPGRSPFSKTAMAPGSGASSISTRMAAATSQCSPALKPRGVHATISTRLNLDGYGPSETKSETSDRSRLAMQPASFSAGDRRALTGCPPTWSPQAEGRLLGPIGPIRELSSHFRLAPDRPPSHVHARRGGSESRRSLRRRKASTWVA